MDVPTSAPPKSATRMVIENTTATITISNKSAKNAFDEDDYAVLADFIKTAGGRNDVKCIVFQGEHGIFSTGNSLEGLQETQDKNRLGQCTRRFLQALVDNQKPMLALVDGAAIGVGATLLFHCDVVVATKRAFFHTPFVDLNVTPEASSSLLAPRQLGYRNAFKLLVLGERWKATKALEYGLIDYTTDTHDEAATLIQQYTKKISKKPLPSLIASRTLLRPSTHDLQTAMTQEIFAFERCISQAH